MNLYQYRISMRVRHPSSKLTDLTERLIRSLPGIIPRPLQNVGEERFTPTGTKLEGVYMTSVFGFSFSDKIYSSQSKELETALHEVLEKLYPCEDLFHEIAEMGCKTEFFIGLFIDANSGVILTSDLLRKLGELNIELGFDIYPPDAEDTTTKRKS